MKAMNGRGAATAAATLMLLGSVALGCGVEGDADDPMAPTATSSALSKVGTDPPVITKPVKVLPPVTQLVSDLKPDGVMRFYSHDATTLGVQINVTNVGNAAAWGPAGSVTINGAAFDSVLYQYYGGTSQMANTVNPGEHGYILVFVPNATLGACASYTLHIDTGHNMQAGLPDPYANDQAAVATQCLSWTATISSNNFPISGPPLEGSSLGRVVSSVDIGRLDNLRCSACHYQNAPGRTYQPPVAQNSSAIISPTQIISGLTWTQPGGWADRFLLRPTDSSLGSKPYHLKMLVEEWINDGRNPGNQTLWNISAISTATLTLAN
ncbi:MAG TPA: hypothetical protein VGP07_10275 [Polyangia bacterium]